MTMKEVINEILNSGKTPQEIADYVNNMFEDYVNVVVNENVNINIKCSVEEFTYLLKFLADNEEKV